ncbi:actin-related protein 8 isoform X1 [Hydra vulgaris]|uniref:Actin-related protein 8 n=2 Tax=Hydra vulgaris TaxID=6087 RepID=T2M5U4_HYDVU|nr:actin-related protein 8 isoform X1 [Hydra vulgaris]
MPRPVKTERPVTTEPVSEPIQGTTIVVLHPGSMTLRLGRATDHFPQSLPHVIARKIRNVVKTEPSCNFLSRNGTLGKISEETHLKGFQATKSFINTMRISGGLRKHKTTSSEVAAYNAQVVPVETENDGSVSWTDTNDDSFDSLIGEQVLKLPPNSPYSCRWPMRFGELNTHSGIGGSISSILTDLETLWGKAIEKYLDIPLKDLSYYRAVLLLPDMMNKSHAKLLIDVILNRLKFSCILVHQESVCGTFGSGLPSACVVDVGAEKTTICCVEDGISVSSSRIQLNYGGNDITRTFYWLLKSINFPYKSLDVNNMFDLQLLQELKETFCHLSLALPSGQVHEFQVVTPDKNIQTYKLRLGDEPLIAPVGMFIPSLFGITSSRLIETYSDVDHDPEDLMDDRYLLEKRDIDAKKSKIDGEEIQECITPPPCLPKEHLRLDPIRDQGMPLDEAIMYSIESCSNLETKRKMYGTVLLIGGGLSFKGADEFLLKRLQAQLPAHYQFVKDQMEVIARPKESDPRNTCWKGGAVLSILDSAQELWISRNEWNKYGVRIVRERCGFQWSSNMDKL